MMTPASGRVLIADDEPLILELLRDFLIGEGYDVATATTGAQVLDAVPTFQPDVIVVDMVMPDLSGRDVLDALRRVGVTVPVILISAIHTSWATGSSEFSGSRSIYGS